MNPGPAPPLNSTTDLTPLIRPDAIRKKLRFGPYKIASSDVCSLHPSRSSWTLKLTCDQVKNFESVALAEPGMTTDFRKGTVPCADCYILSMTGDLEFANGTVANVNHGCYMHHSVLFNTGKGQQMIGCPNILAPVPDPFWFVSNERTTTYFTGADGNFKSGYYIAPNDTFLFYTELMNLDRFEREVYPTIVFEYLPGTPPGFLKTRTAILDINGCSASGFSPPKDKKVFSLTSQPWTIPWDGTIVDIGTRSPQRNYSGLI
jgi:hypothetical protein